MRGLDTIDALLSNAQNLADDLAMMGVETDAHQRMADSLCVKIDHAIRALRRMQAVASSAEAASDADWDRRLSEMRGK